MYQTIILGCTLLVAFHILRRLRYPKKNLNLPPLVSYKIPVIGHTFDFWFNCDEFLEQCRKDYGDIFSVYVFGQIRTIVGKEHAQEILAKDDTFSFALAFRNIIPGEEIFKSSLKDPIRIFKDKIFNKLEIYNERIQRNLHLSTKRYIGDCDEPKTFYKMEYLVAKIISAPVASFLMGEEDAEDDLLTTFASFTFDVAKIFLIPPVLDFIYPRLQFYVTYIPVKLGLFDPVKNHRHILMKHIKNQVEKRLREKQQYGDSWKRPNDLLQDFLDEDDADINDNFYKQLSERMAIFIFSSIHSTAENCTNVLIDLASRPEYMQELYEEQLEIQKSADENDILPFEALNRMNKLDNFIRESLRLSDHIASLPHAVTKDHTFSNGMQIPEGHITDIYADDIIRDESLQGPNPESFDPSRYADKNIPASKIDKGFLKFGGGKHACPGRYLAVLEIKYFMHNVILKYNLRTKSGRIEKKVKFGPYAHPSHNGIIFEKRIKI